MSKWIDRLREHEKRKQARQNDTDKTAKTHDLGVSSVLSVPSGAISANFSEASPVTADDAAALYEERAAILEYDQGLSRSEAERLARLLPSSTIH